MHRTSESSYEDIVWDVQRLRPNWELGVGLVERHKAKHVEGSGLYDRRPCHFFKDSLRRLCVNQYDHYSQLVTHHADETVDFISWISCLPGRSEANKLLDGARRVLLSSSMPSCKDVGP